MSSDQIADMFTCLRNARIRNLQTTTTPYSKFKWKICQKLVEEGFLSDCWVRLKITKKELNASLKEQELVINANSLPLQKWIIPQDLKVNCSINNQIHIQGTDKFQIGEFTLIILSSLKNVHASIKMEVNPKLNEIKKISKSSQEVFFNNKEVKEKCLGKRFYLISTSIPGSELILADYKKAREISFGGKVIGLLRKN